MTTNFYYTLIASALLLLSYACSPTKDIHQGLTRHPASLAYLYDTPPASQQSSLTVGLQSVKVDPLPPTGQLEETKKSVLPLLLYNSWKHEFIYTLGQASVQEDMSAFVRDSWLAESHRSGLYPPSTSAETDFSLEIAVDSIYARGPYWAEGLFVFAFIIWTHSEWERAGPGIAYSHCTYRLKKGNKVLLEGATESKRNSEPLTDQAQTLQKLRNYYTTYLVESLSLTFKDNITHIVTQVNRYLRDNHSETIKTRSAAAQQASLAKASTVAPVPQAKVILYRRRKKQQDKPVSIHLGDSAVATLMPNTYHELSVPLHATELCVDGTCVSVVPSARSTSYLECSLSTQEEATHLEVVKAKVGSFYVKQIEHFQTER